MIWEIKNDTIISSKNYWTYIKNAEEFKKPSHARALINWNNSIDLDIVHRWLNRNQHLEILIHILNGSDVIKLPHLLADFSGSLNQLFYYQEAPNYSREDRFEISTFLGEHSLRRVNPNPKLRELYKYWSYQVLLKENGLDKEQWHLLQEEKNLNPSLNFPADQEAWVKAISKLITKGSTESVDLPSTKTMRGYPVSMVKKLAKKFLKRGSRASVDGLTEYSNDALPEILKADPRTWEKVLITGWYGTETAGDKAILGEIIHQLRTYNPDLEIVISSIDLRVSWQTRIEMNLKVRHIPIQNMSDLLDDPDLDAVVMGGGPLMESSQVLPIARLFYGAAKRGINRVIFGCGVGPIYTSSMSEQIAHIIKLSNIAFYRDQESLDYALRLGGDKANSKLACDPATAFINRWREENPKQGNSNRISTMLREQTTEYNRKADITGQNMVFPSQIAELLTELKKNSSSLDELNLIPMHVYWRGNDDRLLNHKIARHVVDQLSISPYLDYKGIYELLDSLSQSKMAIAMRYHGHIFSIALNIPFISLDYTGKKGKVSNLMQRLGLKDCSVKFENFTPSVLKHKLEQIEANPELEADLRAKTQELIATLNKAYQFFWN